MSANADTGATIFFWLALLGAMVSASLALASLTPRLRVGEPNSLIYFEHVARKYVKDPDGHAAAVKTLLGDEETFFTQIAGQVWANSTVARRKFLWSSWSLFALGVSVLLAAVAAAFAL
jgi:hypothetical protein